MPVASQYFTFKCFDQNPRLHNLVWNGRYMVSTDLFSSRCLIYFSVHENFRHKNTLVWRYCAQSTQWMAQETKGAKQTHSIIKFQQNKNKRRQHTHTRTHILTLKINDSSRNENVYDKMMIITTIQFACMG